MADGRQPACSIGEHEISLLRDAFEDAPFEFWVRDLSGVCVIANAETRRLGTVLGARVEDASVPPAVIAAWQENNRRAYAGEVVQNELEYGEGERRRSLQCYIVPLRIRGEVRGLLGFNIDRTQSKRTEQALRESERRLQESLRVGRMGWLDWDLVTNEIRWSPETCRLFGYDPDSGFVPTAEVTLAMVPAEDQPIVASRLEAAIQGTASFDSIHRVRRGDGVVIHVHAQSEVMRDASGKPLRMLGTVTDVTERRRAEDELREVDRKRTEFLGVLSHELRNPLAVIGSSLRCLEHAVIEDEQARRAIAAIDRQSRQLAHLVDDLLDVTRIRSGKISLQVERVDLVALVARTVDDHRLLLAGRDLKLRLPEAPAWVEGDATRLAQVLGNVLANAAKFTPAHGTIAVSLAITFEHAVLEVADTGIGFDETMLGELFLPFVQAGRDRDGLGLGLSLVKTLVEMHGGTVTARSAGAGRGACFTIMLPLADGELEEPRPRRGVAAAPRKVLVIEDNEDVAEWLATALTFSGHQVTITLDGETGLRKAREVAPDVILCDLGLPGRLDGFAVARALQEDATLANAYRVALSGYAQPEDQKRARDAGFEAHLAKPPDLDVLERLLAELRGR